ncbi:MAG: hypothetical protein ACLTSX_08170 [Collinsella sp.]
MTSDAVAICDADGTVAHVNRQMLRQGRSAGSRSSAPTSSDLLYSVSFERSMGHKVPLHGRRFREYAHAQTRGWLLHSRPRARHRAFRDPRGRGGHEHRYVVAIRSLEEQYAYDRKTQRLLSELKAANKRLSGTLSVIMSTVGSNDMPTLLDTVLNRMAETLDAAGTTIVYFAESGGFSAGAA